MYTALYRTFRPETFSHILGQEHIVKILKNQIAGGTTSHAYLFCGTRGTGKTTTARILAKGVNCLEQEGDKPCGVCDNCQSIKAGTFMDVIEIDAASNNGVENIRELRESVKYPPVVGKCKVYIIDEVHMLSTGAFNALLKTLEEPPENVMFILATTEVQKLPATILSRCLRLDFKRVPEMVLRQGMRDICSQIDIKISDAALGLIAANADGSVRDGLSLLEQCISSGNKSVARDDVLELLGTSGEEVFIEMTDLILQENISDALVLLNKILADGKDVKQFMKDWITHFRSLLMTKFIKNPEDILNMSCENAARVREQSDGLDLQFINDGIIELSKTLSDAKWSTQPRILLELCIVRMGMAKDGQSYSRQVFPQEAAASEPREFTGGNLAAAVPLKAAVTNAENKTSNTHDEGVKVKKPLDYAKLWHSVFEEGETLKGSFNLLRLGTTLKDVGEKTFLVEAESEMVLEYTKENSAELEAIMEKHVGRKLKLECRSANSAHEKNQEDKIEKLANDIGHKLGLNIEIQ